MADYLAMNEFPGTGAVMQVAISFAGNRPDDNSGTTPYFDPADVKGEIITPATATTVEVVEPVVLIQVNATTFKTDRIVATGKVLRVSRHTLTSYPMVDFVDRQIVTENDLDVSSRQVLYAAMEALDQSNLSIRYARQGLTFSVSAVKTANTALGRADFAVTAANDAVGTAGAANATAASAVATANAASQKADQALANASSAEQHAENVETLAARADAASAQALTTANEAKSIASGIDAKATDALSKAGTAVNTANSAKATAEGIDAKATGAVQTANDASTKAASAKATAEGIEAKAISAQETANAANTAANAAQGTATNAKQTADGLASRVDSAQADATSAKAAANDANSNANARVAKTGDTMTGTLVVPTVRNNGQQFTNKGLQGLQGNDYLYMSGTGQLATRYVDAFQMQPGDAKSAQYIVLRDSGAVRGMLYNNPDGSWIARVGNGTEHVLNYDGSVYWKTNYVFKRDATGKDRQLVSEGRNIITEGPELASGIVPNISSANGNHYAGSAVKVSNAGNTSASATMAFHREGQFACYFGLDVDNELAYGGYSYGTVRYRIWSERNFNPAEYVRYDTLRQELGGRGASEVGTYAFAFFNGSANPGDIVSGANLFWGSFNSKGSSIGGGNWRCMGYVRGDNATLWLRVN